MLRNTLVVPGFTAVAVAAPPDPAKFLTQPLVKDIYKE